MTFPYTGERAVPWNPATGGHILAAHIARYAWAVGFVDGRLVVDVASGTGYGAFFLSMAAREVIGVEIDAAAVAFARQQFNAPNLTFEQGDMTVALPDGEVYVAFECLEHVNDPRRALANMRGLLLYSVPVMDASRFHKWALPAHEIEARFGGRIFYQQGGVIVPKERAWFMPEYVLGVVAL